MEDRKYLKCTLVKIPEAQAGWLYAWFNEHEFYMPEMFGDKYEFAEDLAGVGYVRLDNYECNSNSFADDCCLSYTYSRLSEIRYDVLIKVLEDVKKQAELIEYFELCENIATILSYMQRSKQWTEKGEYA